MLVHHKVFAMAQASGLLGLRCRYGSNQISGGCAADWHQRELSG